MRGESQWDKKNPGQTWVLSEPMVGLEPTTSGLQIRFH